MMGNRTKGGQVYGKSESSPIGLQPQRGAGYMSGRMVSSRGDSKIMGRLVIF